MRRRESQVMPGVLVIVMLLSSPLICEGAEEQWQIGLSATYLSGDYGIDLKDQWNYDVGLGYSFTDALLGIVFYEERRALVSGQQNPRDLLFAVSYSPTSNVRFVPAVLAGLSDGSPDYGLTCSLMVQF